MAALAALGATALAVTPAWATGINWSYTVSSTFDTANTNFSTGCGDTNPVSNSATTSQLTWGCASDTNRSSLVISGSPATGSTETDSGNEPLGVVLTHNNFVITGSHLTSTALINHITLVGDGSATDPTPFDLTFGINFVETSNSGTCAVAPESGFAKCPDIFVIDNTSLNHSFTYGDSEYFVSIFPAAGVGNLSKAACQAVSGVNYPCTGFVTQENNSNPLDFAMSITSRKIGVPEPGALGLMGLGLLGLAGLVVLRRRRMHEEHVD